MFKKNFNFVLNSFARDLSPDLLECIKTSVSLQKLFHLLVQETAEDCYSISNGNIISLEEIEKKLFWDVSLDRYYEKNMTTKNKHETLRNENVAAETTLDSILKSIPPYIGLRHPLVLWNFAFMKLLDRAIYFSIHYEILQNQLISTKYSAIKLLIIFHQSLLWNLCLVRFTSQFVMMATVFGKKSILHYINKESFNKEIQRVPDHHPLNQLRFFAKDIVYVSQNPESQLGGGFLGVLCLGNSTLDVEIATRVSAQERLAHEELLKYIVQLKINSARKHFEEEKGIESSYFSIQYLCQNALSHLSPVLSTTVDFHGFRITVYPLPYRPPLELQVDCLSSRVSEELYYINKHNISLLAINPDTNVTFLQIQDELFHCIHLHKVYRLLQPCRSLDTVETRHSHYFRPLSVSMYLEKTTENDLSTEESQIQYKRHFATLDEPYGLLAFTQKRLVCFNPFNLPQLPLNPVASFKKNMRPYPSSECLLRYITTHRIPRVIATLEKQPLYTPYDSFTLRAYLHGQGLNMRYLGLFISGTRPSWIHAMILVEIVSRVSKRFISKLIQMVVLESKNIPTHNSICEPQSLINSRQRHVLELFLKENYTVSRDFIESFLDILFSVSPAREKTHTLWETVSINFLQLLLRSNITSTTLWRFVLAPSAADRFQCHESFIDLSQCPRIALVNAFLHHLGLHVNLEFQGETVLRKNEQATHIAYSYPQRDKLGPTSQCSLKSVTPKGSVALFHTSTSLYKFQHILPLYNHLEQISVDILLQEKEGDASGETKEENDTNSEMSSPHNAKSLSWRYWTDKRETINFLLTSFFIICNAVDDVALLQQRQIALNVLSTLKTNASYQRENTSRQRTNRLLFSLIPEFKMISSCVTKISIKNLPEAWSIQRKNLTHSLSDSLLNMTSWALRNHLWDIAQSTALDSYRTFAKNCIASIHSRRVVGWTAFLSSMTTKNPMSSSSLEKEKYYHDIFQQCLFMVRTYWDASHPINVDTLLSYAWVFYMKQDYETCRQLTSQALSIILIAFKTNDMESWDDFFKKNYNNFPSIVLDPSLTVCSETLPSQFPKEKVGQLYKLLGALDVFEIQEFLLDSNFTDSSFKIQRLIDSALLNFQNAVKILKAAYKDKTTEIILAPPLFEMGTMLFLKYQSTTQSTPDQGDLHQALVYFLSALKLYSLHFKSHHWNVVQTAVCVAKLLVLTDNHLQAMPVFEQILKDILPYAAEFEKLQNTKKESYYDCLFHDGYRSSNMFSLIVWCVPNHYFSEVITTEPSSNSKKTFEKRLQCYKSILNESFKAQFFHVLSETKKSIFSLYINKTIPEPFLSRAFHLFKRFYFIKNTIDRLYDELAQYILSSYKGTDFQWHENISPSDQQENFFPLPLMQNATKSNSLQLIQNYPRLLDEKQVLALLDGDYTKSDDKSSPTMNNLFRNLLTTSKDDLDRLEENIKARRLKHMNLFKTFPLSSFPTGNQSKDTEDYDSTLSDFSTNHNCFDYEQVYQSKFAETQRSGQDDVLGSMRNSNSEMELGFSMHSKKNALRDYTKPFLFSENANNCFKADANIDSPEFTSQCLLHYDQDVQNDSPTENDSQEMTSIKLFSMKRFLGINDPLEWYPLQTLSLDYIFTLFYYYIDISQIENRILAHNTKMSDVTLLGSYLAQEPLVTDTAQTQKHHAYSFLFSEAPSSNTM